MNPCLFCVQSVTTVKSENDQSSAPGEDLIQLIIKSCRLLKVSQVGDSDWHLLDATRHSICCWNCYQCLKTTQETHELLLNTQEKLRRCLEKLENIVATSAVVQVTHDTSWWSETGLKFREELIKRNPPTLREGNTDSKAIADPTDVASLEDEECHSDNDPNSDDSFLCPKSTESRWVKGKKRKIVVIADEDTGTLKVSSPPPSKRSRVTKKRPPPKSSGESDFDSDPESTESDRDDDWEPCEGLDELKDLSQRAKKARPYEVSGKRWITCGISKCERQFVAKAGWKKHAEKAHPKNTDLQTHWNSGGILLTCYLENCNQPIGNKLEFRSHVQSYHPLRLARVSGKCPVQCDMCRQRIPKDKLADHVRSHVGDYSLPCASPHCFRVFCTIRGFHSHLHRDDISCSSRAGDKNWKFDTCQICGFTWSSLKGLQNHIQIMHENDSSVDKCYPCPVEACTERFSHRQSVYFHISQMHYTNCRNDLIVIGSSSQKCPLCKETFSVESLATHLVTIHGADSEEICSCKICPYIALNQEQLVGHFAVHFRSGKLVSCHLCSDGPAFPRLQHLRRHYTEEHQIGSDFICEHCSTTFQRETSLKAHLRRRHAVGAPHATTGAAKIFKCDQCENAPEFDRQTTLIRHQIDVHGATPFKCQICSKEFCYWEYYSAHLKFHTGQRSLFPCDLPGCATVCTSKAELEKHRRSIMHSGRTNAFKCNLCGVGFNTEKACKGHHIQVHVAERNFVCNECGRGFKSKPCLEKHVMIHTGERPFQCDKCEKRFRQKHHLTGHYKSHQM